MTASCSPLNGFCTPYIKYCILSYDCHIIGLAKELVLILGLKNENQEGSKLTSSLKPILLYHETGIIPFSFFSQTNYVKKQQLGDAHHHKCGMD